MPKLSNFLNRNYIKKSNIINKLNADLYASIPPALVSYCRILNLEDNILSVGVDSATWASKLRFYKTEIIKTFNNRHRIRLSDIKISVAPDSKPITVDQNTKKKPHISNDSAQKLISLANTMEHPPLRQALLKLSRHTKAGIKS